MVTKKEILSLHGVRYADFSREALILFNKSKISCSNHGLKVCLVDDAVQVSECEYQDEDLEESRAYQVANPSKADDSFTGIVSFRSEAPDDVQTLSALLAEKFAGLYEFTTEWPEENDAGVELLIQPGLTIVQLRGLMIEGNDLHVMADTLRALPVNENPLQRLDTHDVYDWTGKTEAELMGWPE